jgi:hypothetical protein
MSEGIFMKQVLKKFAIFIIPVSSNSIEKRKNNKQVNNSLPTFLIKK